MAAFKSEGDRRRYYMRQTALIIVNQNAYAEKRLTEGNRYKLVDWGFVFNTSGFYPDNPKMDIK